MSPRALVCALALLATTTALAADGALPDLPRRGRGRVTVAPGGRGFQFEDGTPYVPIGHTEAFSFFNQIMNDRATLEAFCADMRRRGQNVLVVQVENNDRTFYGGHPSDLQYPLGTFHEPIARMFDEFLDIADRHDIQVITYVFDTFHMDFNWSDSPWNVKNGGPCTYVSDFLRDRRAIEHAKRTFDWAIARWGRRRNLLGFELLNEHDWAVAGPLPGNKDAKGRVHGATLEEIEAWHAEMAPYVRRALRLAVGSGPRPLLMSSSNNPNFGRGPDGRPVPPARWFFTSPHLDVVAFHGYIWPPPTSDPSAPLDLKAHGPTTDPRHPLDAFGPIVDAVRYLVRNSDKPVLGTEEGPLGWWIKPGRGAAFPRDDEFFHVMAWGEVAAGAAGPGMRWPYPNFGFGRKPFLNPHTEPMKQSLEAMARILTRLDTRTFAARHVPDGFVPDGDGLVHAASQDAHQLLAWVAPDTRQHDPRRERRSFRVNGLADEPHEVLWFDDRTGRIVATARASGPSFAVTTPPMHRSWALIVRPLSRARP